MTFNTPDSYHLRELALDNYITWVSQFGREVPREVTPIKATPKKSAKQKKLDTL